MSEPSPRGSLVELKLTMEIWDLHPSRVPLPVLVSTWAGSEGGGARDFWMKHSNTLCMRSVLVASFPIPGAVRYHCPTSSSVHIGSALQLSLFFFVFYSLGRSEPDC